MKKIFLAFATFIGSHYCSAQSYVTYSYDLSGNRIGRHFTARMANPDPPKDSIGRVVAIKYGVGVYPNPTRQNVNVVISSLETGQSAIVYLFDLQGKCILTKTQNSPEESIDLTNLSSGIYQLNVLINGERISYRVLKL